MANLTTLQKQLTKLLKRPIQSEEQQAEFMRIMRQLTGGPTPETAKKKGKGM